jgi:pimeloyl-ACP methyl ester carboxylesterase
LFVADRRADFPETSGGGASPPATVVFSENNAGRVVRIRAQDGLSLAVRIFDAADSGRLPLLCLPGLSRNSRDFLALGQFFSSHLVESRRVIAVDYRGRGLSDADPDWRNYKPIVEAEDVLSVTAALGIERAILVGTSRGGIISMLIGMLRPALIAGVVLNDIGPVLEGRGLARIKAYLSGRHSVASWEEATALVRSISEAQFPALSDADWRSLAAAYFAETRSGLAPQFDPNLRKTVVDIDVTEKIPVLWPQFMSMANVPVLAIRGEHSDLLSPRTLAEMALRHPRLEQFTVPGQGHAPLLSDEATLTKISAFTAACDR